MENDQKEISEEIENFSKEIPAKEKRVKHVAQCKTHTRVQLHIA